MGLLTEWSTRQRRRAATPATVAAPATCDPEPAKQNSIDPAGPIGTNGTIGTEAFTTPVPTRPMPVLDFSRVAKVAGVAALHLPVDRLPPSLKAAFDERAAIAEVEGGLDREAAELLAWDEVNAGPIGDTLQDWQAWMNYRLRAWMGRGLPHDEAKRSTWSEAELKWHHRHGAPPDPDRCAGCGEWMLDGPGMRFDDGAVVHFGNPDRFDCLIVYGEAWGAAASAGLVALGLRKPQP
jgi:hypothetical protein